MTYEAILIYETELPIPYNVTNAAGIEKGAVLKLTDGMTAIINSGAENQIAGIAAEEKIASDGRTKLGVYRRGIFKVYAAAAVTIGQALSMSATVNEFQAATKTSINCKAVAIALEACNAAHDLITVAFNADGVNNNLYA